MKYEFDIEDLINDFNSRLNGNSFIYCSSLEKFLKDHQIKEPLKIEVGKFYKSERGCKVYIFNKEDTLHYSYQGVINKLGRVFYFTKNGSGLTTDLPADNLISEWKD